MDGLAAVSTRISEIESRIVSIASLGGATRPTAGNVATGTSFNGVLNGVLTANNASGAGAGRLNARGVPVELEAYGNGRVPANALRPVGGTGHRLWDPAARSFESLLEAARRDGVQIGITDSYRPYAEQVDLARRKGLYSQGGLAAKPGTSDHGWGLSVDLNLNAKAQAWMRANATRFGFTENVPREPWHWTYKPAAG